MATLAPSTITARHQVIVDEQAPGSLALVQELHEASESIANLGDGTYEVMCSEKEIIQIVNAHGVAVLKWEEM